jgi:hypothetical protein
MCVSCLLIVSAAIEFKHQVLSIRDLSYTTGRRALTHMRISRKKHQPDEDDVEKAVSTVGGRVAYLGKVSRADDVVKGAKELLQWEKAWLLSQIGLIPDCDDDVMDEVCFGRGWCWAWLIVPVH